MPKLDKRSLRPCILEPVEKEVENPLPGVPIHFNHGIFYTDSCDYTKYLKSVSEFQDTSTFRITGIPEDAVLETSDRLQATSSIIPREPDVEADDRPAGKGLRFDSDAEIAEGSDDNDDEPVELEDNFIELAGGHQLKDSETSEVDDLGADQLTSRDKQKSGLKSLREEKVMLMERFLYGDNERRDSDGEEISDTEMEFLDEVTRENRNFEKLIQKCRQQRSDLSASQSCITGTSVMSEGLQFALSRDSCTLLQRKPRTDDLEELDGDLKLRTVTIGREQLQESDEEDRSSSSEVNSLIVERMDVMSIQSEATTSKSFATGYLLTVPTDGKARRCRTRKDPNDLDGPSTVQMESLTSDVTHHCRRQGETQEEKRLRKSVVKQARRIRRQVRKANQSAFREEQKHQTKTLIPPIR